MRIAADIQYHLSDNGESVDEIASFIELAATAHTLFDVGAWKGLFSLVFCLSGDHRRAVAYEPSSAGAAAVVTLADHNQCAARVTIRRAAVGRSSGRTGYHEAPGGIVTIGADGSGLEDAGDLQLVSLDDEVRSSGIVPDLLKIDVEGYEYEVLAGARNLLRDHKPAISLELHLDLLERRGQSAGANHHRAPIARVHLSLVRGTLALRLADLQFDARGPPVRGGVLTCGASCSPVITPAIPAWDRPRCC